jgi:hypothetical protein
MTWMQNAQFGIVRFQTLRFEAVRIIVSSNFEISAPQCSVHYTYDRRGDAVDNVVHQHIWLSEVIIMDILDSDHLPVMLAFWILLEQGKL